MKTEQLQVCILEEPQFCERCGKKMSVSNSIELHLNESDGLYYAEGTFPADGSSQGWFSFGKDCVKTILKNGGKQDWGQR